MQIVETVNHFTVNDKEQRGVMRKGRKETIRVVRVSGHHLLVEQGENLLCHRRPGLRPRASRGKQAD